MWRWRERSSPPVHARANSQCGGLVCFDVRELILGGRLWPKHGLEIERSVFFNSALESASYVEVDLNERL